VKTGVEHLGRVTYIKLRCVSLVSRVELLDVVLGILDDDLVGLAVETENYHDGVLLSVFCPPRRELQALDLI